MYTNMEREIIRKAIEIIKSYEGKDIDITLCPERITSYLEDLVNDIESEKNTSSNVAIQGAANLITECIEQDGDISLEDKMISMEIIAGLSSICNCDSDYNKDSISRWQELVSQEEKITSIKSYRVLEMLIEVLGKDTSLEEAFDFISTVREENKKNKAQDWKNIRDYVVKDLIGKVTYEYSELADYNLESKINWMISNLEESGEGENFISIMKYNNTNSRLFSLLSDSDYMEYIIAYLLKSRNARLFNCRDVSDKLKNLVF